MRRITVPPRTEERERMGRRKGSRLGGRGGVSERTRVERVESVTVVGPAKS